MDSPKKQKTEGAIDEAKGKAKQAWGDLTDDKSTHAEGQIDEAKGKAKQKIGEARDDLRKNI
ncbi:MAG: CsbD family protein [Rubricoccaceae bacterium]|nr:CsbD family protein [Rubricoccaceae bacterium]